MENLTLDIKRMMFSFFNKKFLILEGMGFDSIFDYFQNVFVNKGVLAFSAIFMGKVVSVDHYIAFHIFCHSQVMSILFGANFLEV